MEFMAFIVPTTLVLVELLKTLEVPVKLLSLLALLLGGLLGGVFSMYYNTDLFEAIFTGCLQGATACGLYDVSKNTTSYILNKK